MTREPGIDLGGTEDVCPRCQNFRNAFNAQLVDIDRLLRQQAASHVEVNALKGTLEEGEVDFMFDEITLRLGFRPRSQFAWETRIDNMSLPRKVVDAIRSSLRESSKGFNIAGETPTLVDVAIWALQLLEETVSRLQIYRTSIGHHMVSDDDAVSSSFSARLDTESVHHKILDWVGIDPTAFGSSIRKAAEWQSLRISHVEVIVRNDLTIRFMRKRQQMRDALTEQPLDELRKLTPYEFRSTIRGNEESQKQALVDHITKPRLTFHGTESSKIGSIVQHGFLKPGDAHPITGWTLGVRCGSTYGRGIYSSPDPSFSLAYSSMDAAETRPSDLPGLKLIVCATLMGRTAQLNRGDDWRSRSEPYPGADSHAANNSLEYIVFDAAQILPCYVVHLDWGEDTERRVAAVRERAFQAKQMRRRGVRDGIADDELPRFVSPGDLQRQKQERMAIGRKFFAYGFGPVSGNKLVIEDVAPVDDDEEDYGDYQAQRYEENREAVSAWDWRPEIEGWTDMDQYVDERTAMGVNKRKCDVS